MKFKKFVSALSPVFMALFLSGCFAFNMQSGSKPSLNHYTTSFASLINKSKISKVVSYETDRSKDQLVDKNLYYVICGFVGNLSDKNAIESPSTLQENPIYKLYLTFTSGERYVFEIFDDDIVALYPWDGEYKKDFISSKDIPRAYNLYRMCTYLYPKI